MSWTSRPFNYYGTSPTQILDDLTKANDNFEILGQAFVNNNPTTQMAKNADRVDGYHASQTPSANTIPVANALGVIANAWLSNAIRGFENPVDPIAYYNSTGQDYPLAVGEVARYYLSGSNSYPLRIATSSPSIYLFYFACANPINSGGSVGITILANNQNYSGAFKRRVLYENESGGPWIWRDDWGGFSLCESYASGFGMLCNITVAKVSLSFTINWFPTSYIGNHKHILTSWHDTTTLWTSLGTIVTTSLHNIYLLIYRIL
ncbi:MAG: hypothetical protein QXT86_10520 [Archaeoglobaceae archaeon]